MERNTIIACTMILFTDFDFIIIQSKGLIYAYLIDIPTATQSARIIFHELKIDFSSTTALMSLPVLPTDYTAISLFADF